MDPEVVARLREALEQERRSLRAQLAEHGADPDDLVIENLRQTLGDVEHALGKIQAGSGYGMCERCGREIGQERLEALPWARLCISCKQEVG